MKTHNLIWKGLSHLSTEYARVIEREDVTAFGHIVGYDEGTPFFVEYILSMDTSWRINGVILKLMAQNSTLFNFRRDESGSWVDVNDVNHPELEGCDFVDISLTPFTNTLPIRNLNLQVDESREIKVLYFDLPKGEFKPQRQRYTNKGNGVYKYEGLDTGFEAEVIADNDGFVTLYEGIWERVNV